MARLTACRFCGANAFNDEDHAHCAKKFGEPIEQEILKCYRNNVPVPETITAKLKSKEWKWYNEYLKGEAAENAAEVHMKKIRQDVENEVKTILEYAGNAARIRRKNKALGHRKFNIKIETVVTVAPELVF